MKKILISLGIIGLVGAMAIGATISYFSDTETSSGNIFTAGSIDLKVDHKFASYNGNACVEDCVEGTENLVQNGDFETPVLGYGSWHVYSNADAGITKWNVESGAGLEIQNHAAGAPHGGQQLAELDSDNSSSISQEIATVAGVKYRLTFWHSPRPSVPVGDNTIGAVVKVVSDGTVLVNATVGAGSGNESSTVWTKYTYNFVAAGTATKIIFTDEGASNNSLGGYLDDISVRTLACSSTYPNAGTCTLWGERDLGAGDYFWKFDDIKPGDYGINVVSLHATSNDAYACLITNHIVDLENTLIDPEAAAGDTTATEGELSQFIKVFAWYDNGNGAYESGEAIISGPNSPLSTVIGKISLTPSSSKYVGIAWCAGTQNLADTTISCSGSTMGNIAQTDSFTADVTAYAVQQRNNPNFTCASVVLP